MRTGPARTYPATWLYVRADLPIKVVAVYRDWRKVEDPDGTQGWMLVNLLSSQRTAIVRDAIAELRAAPDAGAAVNWRAEPGVVGRISKCSASRSEEHTSELQSLMRISYAVFCLQNTHTIRHDTA